MAHLNRRGTDAGDRGLPWKVMAVAGGGARAACPHGVTPGPSREARCPGQQGVGLAHRSLPRWMPGHATSPQDRPGSAKPPCLPELEHTDHSPHSYMLAPTVLFPVGWFCFLEQTVRFSGRTH